ncbi:Mechanosensitive ion channel protein 10 [Vitis vinifera]|uniref:Mechanosensitive ion channel protein 10 n=1 Tax=Vitis vinifera TaxID=29760 RepID=A0A438E8Q8_VITVI|nr:Mechanosensitive ion channel protein 10 [Vitis vinifera]
MESGREAARKTDGFKSFSKDSQASIELERLKSRVQVTPKTTPSSPDTPRSPSASKPPKVPTESVRIPGCCLRVRLKLNRASPVHSLTATTPRDNVKTAPVTPQTPGGEDEAEEEDEEVYKTSYFQKRKRKIAAYYDLEFGNLEMVCAGIGDILWESGHRTKSVLVFIWLGLILLAWGLLIDSGVKRSRKTTRILNYVTRALASCLVGAVLWLAKALLIKILASSFHVTRFFDRIQESLFHQYVLQTLSKPPSMETTEMVGRGNSPQLSFRSEMKQKGGKKEEVVDVGKLYKIDQEKVSAWTMKGLIDVIRGSRLTTISNVLDDSVDDEGGEHKDKEIANEWEARTTAVQIFENVAKSDPKYIHEKDLWCFMKKQDVDNLLPLFEGASETRKIKRSSFKKWVVKVYSERKSLALSLNDAKTAIEELNKITSGVTLIVIIIVWLLLMGLVTTKVLILISSQLLLAAFMFGNTCKTVFEAMIFVFVMHPFDVGDRCVIDGVQMTVEEVNILTTIFLRYDNEKIFYPNSVLATKPISNFYRSPEMGGDSVEFAVDFSTSMETIAALKDGIKTYLENKPQHWRPVHSGVGEGYCSCEPDEYGSLCHPHHKLSELWGQEQPQI